MEKAAASERWRIDIPVVLGVRSLHVGVSHNAVQGLALERLARGQFLILADVIRRRGWPRQDHGRHGQLEQDEQHRGADLDSPRHPANVVFSA